jgi:ParB-like chromosome segregation protein Spo0J
LKPKRNDSLSADYAILTKQLQKEKLPTSLPTALPLSEIRLWPKVFQHRSFGGAASKSHVIALAAAIKKRRSKSVDPILIWWDGKDWACVDGHHRYEAYLLAGTDISHSVPVEVFDGSLNQAMRAAAEANTKDKLPMSRSEKSNTAWHLVTMADMSKVEVSKASSVSESTVATMRKVFIQLESKVNDEADDLMVPLRGDFRDLSWADAKRLAEGRSAADFDRDEANEKKAQEMALALRKSLGAEGAKYPEVFARALEIYASRLPEQLAEYWRDEEESEANEQEDSDF